MTDKDFLLTFYERDLVRLAQCYDLADSSEKERSVSDLEALFFRIIRYIEAPLFVEAGANDAIVSKRARKNLPEARIVAFEANPFNYSSFFGQKHLEQCRIEYFNFALSDSNETTTFSLRTMEHGEALEKVQEKGSLKTPLSKEITVEKVEVQSVALDIFFDVNDISNSAVWVDVEGAHDKVLNGAKNFLEKSTAAVFMEVEDRENWKGQWLSRDVHSFMLERGFIPCARDFQSRYQYNVLYLKQSILDIDYVKYCLTMHMSFAGSGLMKKLVAAASQD